MANTIVKDSDIDDNWLRQAMSMSPPSVQIGNDGKPTGNLISGLVRLAYCDHPQGGLLRPGVPKKGDGPGEKEPKFSTTLLWPPGVNLQPFYDAYYVLCAKDFAAHYNPNTNQYAGIHSPFHDGAEKPGNSGFTPGGITLGVSSKFKPMVVDSNDNPIVREEDVFSGCWAIVVLNAYSYNQLKKGVAFGPLGVKVVAKDRKLGGGGLDSKAMSGLNVPPPPVAPGSLFGGSPSMAGPSPMGPPGAFAQPPGFSAPVPSAVTVSCWACGSPALSGHPCPGCGTVQ